VKDITDLNINRKILQSLRKPDYDLVKAIIYENKLEELKPSHILSKIKAHEFQIMPKSKKAPQEKPQEPPSPTTSHALSSQQEKMLSRMATHGSSSEDDDDDGDDGDSSSDEEVESMVAEYVKKIFKYVKKVNMYGYKFTSNFAGAMGRSGTRMDLAMVKQEQGETLRKYMRRFFDKRATVVDVTGKEVIDLFQDGLYHCRTFEDFGRCRLSSITKLKDMITSWANEEDKANAKYDAIRGKSKKNAGGSSNNNNKDLGGRNNNYSGPNRKRKPDNIVAAI
jgi:hypothetical protein